MNWDGYARGLENQLAECNATIAGLQGRVQGYQDALAERTAERDRLAKDLSDMRRYYRKPTHGPCCTCQACGQHYDECRCDLDDVADELDATRDDLRMCAEALRNIFNILKRNCAFSKLLQAEIEHAEDLLARPGVQACLAPSKKIS